MNQSLRMNQMVEQAFLYSTQSLAYLQGQLRLASERHARRELQFDRALASPNFVEIALVANRVRTRAAWLNVARTQDALSAKQLVELLQIRSLFTELLSENKVVPKRRVASFAAYLATSACPRVATLCDFCEIGVQSARLWLKRASALGILLRHDTAKELFFVAPKVLGLVSGLSAELISRQFEMLVRNPDWLKTSRYLVVS